MHEHKVFASELERMRADTSRADESEDPVRTGELRAMFNSFLPDAQESEFQTVAAIQQQLRLQQRRIAYLRSSGVIDEAEANRDATKEADWAFRQCATTLGNARFEQLFGIDPYHAAFIQEASSESVLLAAYRPQERERAQVVEALRASNPQSRQLSSPSTWSTRSKYRSAAEAIKKAEYCFKIGEVKESLSLTQSALREVSAQKEIGDAGIYLVAWARHVEGKIYEAEKHWASASASYEASLALKVFLEEWLPPAALVTTEVKLAGIERIHSPAESVTRLNRVVESLIGKKHTFSDNVTLYKNLLEDSYLRIAQAYLVLGNKPMAARNAQKALKFAVMLNDSPGELQTIVVLYAASDLSRENVLQRSRELIKENPNLERHPAIALLSEILD